MSKKKVNLIVSILNIISVLIILIFGNIVVKGIIDNGGTLSLMATSDGFNMTIRRSYTSIMIILLGVSIVSNIICGMQNKETKKLSIFYFLFAILQIINLILIKSTVWNIIGILEIAVIVMQYMYIRNQGNQIETNKSIRIMNIIVHFIIYSLTIVTILIINIVFLIRYTSMYSKRKGDLNRIIDEVSTSSAYSKEEEFFQVVKNKKFGYINENGLNVIPCEYDSITDFCKTNINGIVYEIAIGTKNGEYYLITKDNKIVASGNKILDWQNELVEQVALKEENKDYILCLKIAELIKEMDEEENTEETSEYVENVLEPTETGDSYAIYREDNFSIMLEPYTDDTVENLYKVRVEDQDGNITEDIAYIPMQSKELGAIKLFSNRYIPFYSYKNRAPGWYDYYGKPVFLNQRFEILDVYDDIAVLRIIERDNIVFSTHDWERILSVKEVTLCDNGYIIKKMNDKVVYIDKNLNQMTDEYDYLQVGTEEVLIATNIFDDGRKESFLIDINGSRLIEDSFDLIKKNGENEFKDIQKGEKLENNYVMKGVDYAYRLKLN